MNKAFQSSLWLRILLLCVCTGVVFWVLQQQQSGNRLFSEKPELRTQGLPMFLAQIAGENNEEEKGELKVIQECVDEDGESVPEKEVYCCEGSTNEDDGTPPIEVLEEKFDTSFQNYLNGVDAPDGDTKSPYWEIRIYVIDGMVEQHEKDVDEAAQRHNNEEDYNAYVDFFPTSYWNQKYAGKSLTELVGRYDGSGKFIPGPLGDNASFKAALDEEISNGKANRIWEDFYIEFEGEIGADAKPCGEKIECRHCKAIEFDTSNTVSSANNSSDGGSDAPDEDDGSEDPNDDGYNGPEDDGFSDLPDPEPEDDGDDEDEESDVSIAVSVARASYIPASQKKWVTEGGEGIPGLKWVVTFTNQTEDDESNQVEATSAQLSGMKISMSDLTKLAFSSNDVTGAFSDDDFNDGAELVYNSTKNLGPGETFTVTSFYRFKDGADCEADTYEMTSTIDGGRVANAMGQNYNDCTDDGGSESSASSKSGETNYSATLVAPLAVGANERFTINGSVSNTGDDDANPPRISITLPIGIAVDRAISGGRCSLQTSGNNLYNCLLNNGSTMRAGDTAEFSFDVFPESCGLTYTVDLGVPKPEIGEYYDSVSQTVNVNCQQLGRGPSSTSSASSDSPYTTTVSVEEGEPAEVEDRGETKSALSWAITVTNASKDEDDEDIAIPKEEMKEFTIRPIDFEVNGLVFFQIKMEAGDILFEETDFDYFSDSKEYVLKDGVEKEFPAGESFTVFAYAAFDSGYKCSEESPGEDDAAIDAANIQATATYASPSAEQTEYSCGGEESTSSNSSTSSVKDNRCEAEFDADNSIECYTDSSGTTVLRDSSNVCQDGSLPKCVEEYPTCQVDLNSCPDPLTDSNESQSSSSKKKKKKASSQVQLSVGEGELTTANEFGEDIPVLRWPITIVNVSSEAIDDTETEEDTEGESEDSPVTAQLIGEGDDTEDLETEGADEEEEISVAIPKEDMVGFYVESSNIYQRGTSPFKNLEFYAFQLGENAVFEDESAFDTSGDDPPQFALRDGYEEDLPADAEFTVWIYAKFTDDNACADLDKEEKFDAATNLAGERSEGSASFSCEDSSSSTSSTSTVDPCKKRYEDGEDGVECYQDDGDTVPGQSCADAGFDIEDGSQIFTICTPQCTFDTSMCLSEAVSSSQSSEDSGDVFVFLVGSDSGIERSCCTAETDGAVGAGCGQVPSGSCTTDMSGELVEMSEPLAAACEERCPECKSYVDADGNTFSTVTREKAVGMGFVIPETNDAGQSILYACLPPGAAPQASLFTPNYAVEPGISSEVFVGSLFSLNQKTRYLRASEKKTDNEPLQSPFAAFLAPERFTAALGGGFFGGRRTFVVDRGCLSSQYWRGTASEEWGLLFLGREERIIGCACKEASLKFGAATTTFTPITGVPHEQCNFCDQTKVSLPDSVKDQLEADRAAMSSRNDNFPYSLDLSNEAGPYTCKCSQGLKNAGWVKELESTNPKDTGTIGGKNIRYEQCVYCEVDSVTANALTVGEEYNIERTPDGCNCKTGYVAEFNGGIASTVRIDVNEVGGDYLNPDKVSVLKCDPICKETPEFARSEYGRDTAERKDILYFALEGMGTSRSCKCSPELRSEGWLPLNEENDQKKTDTIAQPRGDIVVTYDDCVFCNEDVPAYAEDPTGKNLPIPKVTLRGRHHIDNNQVSCGCMNNYNQIGTKEVWVRLGNKDVKVRIPDCERSDDDGPGHNSPLGGRGGGNNNAQAGLFAGTFSGNTAGPGGIGISGAFVTGGGSPGPGGGVPGGPGPGGGVPGPGGGSPGGPGGIPGGPGGDFTAGFPGGPGGPGGLTGSEQPPPPGGICGDGNVDEGEQCDDGNLDNGDGCSGECLLENICGDGELDGDEQCDDGNTIPGDGCNERCRFEICGNGIKEVGELCDDGNNGDGDGCSGTCIPELCGDGVLQPGEECDNGSVCSQDVTQTCRLDADCRLCIEVGPNIKRCGGSGFGVECQVDEDCVDTNFTCNYDGSADVRCGPDCLLSVCGNGRIEIDEQCDDGEANSNTEPDTCRTDCSVPFCGDRIVDSIETCDEGENNGGNNPGDCQLDCTFCGDGNVNEPFEECDAGEQNDDQGPNRCRRDCSLPTCGDGVVDDKFSEQCDDGNRIAGDGCNEFCISELCGDGKLDDGEECDDFNNQAQDGCSPLCRFEYCGDGLTQGQMPVTFIGEQPNPELCSPEGDCIPAPIEQCDNGSVCSQNPELSCRFNEDCWGCLEVVNGISRCGGEPSAPLCQTDEDCLAIGPLPFTCEYDINNNSDCDEFCQSTTAGCGNGIPEPPEECDDGNRENDDGCSSACILERCGDGILQQNDFVNEQCDNGSVCNYDATRSCITNFDCQTCEFLPNSITEKSCGGIIDGTPCQFDQDCLFNEDIFCEYNFAADPDCVDCTQGARLCGNGFLELGEECDDGNNQAEDGCDASCQIEFCGDGTVQSTLPPLEVDGTILPNTPPLPCSGPDCPNPPIPSPETCDNGSVCSQNVDMSCRFNEDCFACLRIQGTDVRRCGGEPTAPICTSDEECLLQPLPFLCLYDVESDLNCNDACQSLRTLCGNGFLEPNEECDDGNNASDDGCSVGCRLEFCGDNVVQEGIEDCDNGSVCSNDSGKSCRFDADCQLCELVEGTSDVRRCGGDPNGDLCQVDAECIDSAPFTCQYFEDRDPECPDTCLQPKCGNGEIDEEFGETCDDGNTDDGDGCTSECISTLCGDGFLDVGEQCDDGNNSPQDGCSPNCKNEFCGDGIVQERLQEQCDLGGVCNTDTSRRCTSNAECRACERIRGTEVRRCGGNGDAPLCETDEDCIDEVALFCLRRETVDPDAGCLDCQTVIDGDDSDTDVENTTCGNGVLEEGEQCDDGNSLASDGCSPNCRNEFCGDGVVQELLFVTGINGDRLAPQPEQCDSGSICSQNRNLSCASQADCRQCLRIQGTSVNRCGGDPRGILCTDDNDCTRETQYQCLYDLAANPSCPLCQSALCGDGRVQPGEQCDDGNASPADGCSPQCFIEFCGDGVIQQDAPVRLIGGRPDDRTEGKVEQCDNGSVCSQNDGLSCRTDLDCNVCLPIANSSPNLEDVLRRCGGDPNGRQCQTDRDCRGGSYTCEYDENNDICDGLCQIQGDTAARCGDGIVQPRFGEQCDDGNANNNDSCNNFCRFNDVDDDDDVDPSSRCGDGIIQAQFGEQCDDGNDNDEDSCSNRCRLNDRSRCGDGVVQAQFGEECDDGNQVDDDSCTNRCRLPAEEQARCGDGIIQAQFGEQCDDGNLNNNDDCSNRCRLNRVNEEPRCGDEIIQAALNEQCDDGNTTDGDGCSRLCRLEEVARARCGDGILQAQFGEQCDDGNNADGDDCSARCQIEETTQARCGDGIVQSQFGEQCDDGNTASGDGCNRSCQIERASATGGPGGDGGSTGVITTGQPDRTPDTKVPVIETFPRCGDGILIVGEQCDDGNTIDNDGCSSLCRIEGDALLPTSDVIACGNGIIEEGEECDDANNENFDGCSSECLIEFGFCGDGVVEKALGEQCEPILHDPNLPFKCNDTTCRYVSDFCGNGQLDPGEACDDGADNSQEIDARCRLDCSFGRCGDGVLDSSEQCDDGNRLRGDGCDNICLFEVIQRKIPLVKTDTGIGLIRTDTVFNDPIVAGEPEGVSVEPETVVRRPELYTIPANANPVANVGTVVPIAESTPQTGPASVAVMAAGAAAGIGWARRRRRK